MKLIGVAGKSRSGKDTAAKLIQKTYSNVYILHFADKLKAVVGDLFKLTHTQLYGESKDVATKYNYVDPNTGEIVYVTPGKILQLVGEALRKVYPNIWIENVFPARMHTVLEGGNSGNIYLWNPDIVVIADVRHINEAEWIKDNEGLLIKLHRTVESSRDKTHVSETAMDTEEFNALVDYHIYNSGSVPDLESVLLEIVKEYFNANGICYHYNK